MHVWAQVEVKTAAFSALKGVSGVSNRYTVLLYLLYLLVVSWLTLTCRSQLQQLLIRLGLLQHVETNEVQVFPQTSAVL